MGVLDANTKMFEEIESDSSFTFTDAVASPTQSIHSQSLSPSFHDEVGGKCRDDCTQLIEDTLPLLDDVRLYGDGMDTQILDLDDQTQVLDSPGETQVLEEWNTAVVQDNGEDEECGNTQFLGDTQVLSENDYVKRGCDGVLDARSTPNNCLKKDVGRNSESLLNVLNNEEQCSGSMVREFTSVRVASLRACGLAARNCTFNKLNANSISTKSHNILPGHITDEDTCRLENGVHQQNSRDDLAQLNQFRLKKVGKSTARKLFTDEEVSPVKQLDDPVSLNYVNSEEPEELSQANALEVVNELIENNDVGDDAHVAFKRSTGGKGKLSSTARGVRSFAKKATTNSTVALSGAYHWDDHLEDEGGGEFFQKNKNMFFSNGKTPCLSSKRSANCQRKRGKEKPSAKRNVIADVRSQKNTRSRKNHIENMDEKMNNVSADVRSQKKTRSRKNHIENMDEQMNNPSEEGEKINGTDKNVCNIVDVCYDHENGDEGKTRVTTRKDEVDKGSNMTDNRVITRQSKKARVCVESRPESRLTKAEQAKNVKKQSDKQTAVKQPKKAKAVSEDHGKQSQSTASKIIEETGEGKVHGKSCKVDEKCVTSSTDPKALVKCTTQEQLVFATPVAKRTRGSSRLSRVTSGKARKKSRESTDVAGSSIIIGIKAGAQSGKDKSCKTDSKKTKELENLISIHPGQSTTEIPSYPMRRRTRSLLSVSHEATDQENRTSKRLKIDAKMNHSSACRAKSTPACFSKVEEKRPGSLADVVMVMHSKTKGGGDSKNPFNRDVVCCLEATPKGSNTPSVSRRKIAASPVYMGDEYHKQSWKKNPKSPSLKKERNRLIPTISVPTTPVQVTRKRSDLVSVRVIFSRHLCSDVLKHQKELLTRLGGSEASSMLDASHFVADAFMGTRNMLEAIASGKPVVTHLWLESCAQASCFLDESNYILRDAIKEKELGFSMPFSLARAGQYPILKGQRVLITPNIKPGKEILANLVKAVHGLVVERLGRSLLVDEKLANDLLILSCEEDYITCLPFLEKGASVYSSELLLNGIVTQRLDYDRYCIFTDIVKRTRSTLWLKKNDQFVPTCKGK